MGVGDHIMRTSVLVRWLVVGCCLLAGPYTRAGNAAVAPATNPTAGSTSQSGPTAVSGTYDAGESLRIGTRQIRLLRSQQKVAVIHAPTAGIQAASTPEQIETSGRVYRLERYLSKPAVTVFQTRKFTSLDEQTRSMRQLEEQTAADEVVPVYIHEDSGLEMIPTGKIVVKLKAEDDISGLAGINRRLGTRVDRRIRGTTNQYILSAPHATARELFDLCATLERDSAIEWAEPDFLSQAVKHALRPNDPLFDPNQWYLKDINVPQAWDITTGSSQVIIAILDDGMDLKHEDLKGALPSNTGEFPNNGIDDDRNGWKDDVNGWNFHDDNNDPSPGYLLDDHGTQVAGLAAATGNNGKGIAGCAFGCKLMPLKVLRGDAREEKEDAVNRTIAEALYYAAGQTENGRDRWRGADVISISLGFSETNLVNTALQFAVQHGRNDKGCPTFCASGNDGSGWVENRIYGIDAGTHHFRWELARDGSGSDGSDTVWIDSIVWPDGTAGVAPGFGPAHRLENGRRGEMGHHAKRCPGQPRHDRLDRPELALDPAGTARPLGPILPRHPEESQGRLPGLLGVELPAGVVSQPGRRLVLRDPGPLALLCVGDAAEPADPVHLPARRARLGQADAAARSKAEIHGATGSADPAATAR